MDLKRIVRAKLLGVLLWVSGISLFLILGVCGMYVYSNLLDHIVVRPFILDDDDLEDVVPNRGMPIYVRNKEGTQGYTSRQSTDPVLKLTARAVVYSAKEMPDWLQVDIYGWVWSESISEVDGALRLTGVAQENMRASANNIIVAVLFPEISLKKLAVSENEAWTLCHVSAWENSNQMTKKKPARFLSGMYPVMTVTIREGGEFSKRTKIKQLYDSAPLLLVFIFLAASFVISLSYRLIRSGPLLRSDSYTQHHTGSGDNVLSDKKAVDIAKEQEDG